MLFETKSDEDHPRGSSDADLTLNQLVMRSPVALEVLHGHGMDTCCGGSLTLAEACRRHGVDLADLLEEVARAGG